MEALVCFKCRKYTDTIPPIFLRRFKKDVYQIGGICAECKIYSKSKLYRSFGFLDIAYSINFLNYAELRNGQMVDLRVVLKPYFNSMQKLGQSMDFERKTRSLLVK